ncbi:MAG: outer membrane protein assembly factor [Bacteroidales bacterium]|nr:outer membrane protein assembly factor [Bacteroidales bacterium]
MKTLTFMIILTIIIGIQCFAVDPDKNDSTFQEKQKEGLNFGVLPVLGYNSDIGIQFGAVLNLFQYGDGSLYPEYKYSIYTEVSRTTKGGGINQLFFDSKHLLPKNIRITADLSYLTELAIDFYGYNGYEAPYTRDFEDKNNPGYISRMYYKHQRRFFRFLADFQGKLYRKKLLWLFGAGYFGIKASTVDIDKINRNKKDENKLPEAPLLYDEYVSNGIIEENEKDGGDIPFIKAGIIFDSRDNEPNPNKGIWTEFLLFGTPGQTNSWNYSYLKLAVTHRQYIPLVFNTFSLAYRLGYQGTLAGNVPFYMQPYMIQSFAKVTTTDGLGGAKSVRGILRNRVIGDGFVFGNIELRWKFLKRIWWNQNVYLALNIFTDGGMVIQEINFEKQGLPDSIISGEKENLHPSAGAGFRVAVNQNFIIAADYGVAFDRRDGKDGIYLGIGYLF